MAGSALKVDAIKGAYSQLRINGLTIDPTPEDLELSLTRLENMAAEFEASNICMGFNLEDEPDPNSDLGSPREFWQCIETNLAIRLIPDFNKAVPAELKQLAMGSLRNAHGISASRRIREVAYPSRQPRGSGNTHRYYRWNQFYQQADTVPNDCKLNHMIFGDVDDFVEHFDAYLGDTEVIDSYTFSVDDGLIVSDDTSTGTDINYRVEAKNTDNASDVTRQITIIMTTDTGRVETRLVYFELAAS